MSGDYSVDMWKAINHAKSKSELRMALYFVCCRMQELEDMFDKGAGVVLIPDSAAGAESHESSPSKQVSSVPPVP